MDKKKALELCETILQDLKKSEDLAKDVKGVHLDTYRTQYIKNGKTQHGISEAGIKAREAKHPKTFEEYNESPKMAKEIHKQKLSDLKSMPKPNLPKSEEVKKVDPKTKLPGVLMDKSEESKKKVHGWIKKNCMKSELEKTDIKNPQYPKSPGPKDSKLKAVGKKIAAVGAGIGATALAGPPAGVLAMVGVRNALSPGKARHDKDVANFHKKINQIKDIKAERQIPKPNLPKSELKKDGEPPIFRPDAGFGSVTVKNEDKGQMAKQKLMNHLKGAKSGKKE